MKLGLPVRVYGREGGDREWTEMTRLIDVTPFGARFGLSRPIDIGRLLQLTLAMPRTMRVFDHVEDQYRVWSIVRNVKFIEQPTSKSGLVEVGVAFIGKRPPRSYESDPTRRYEIEQTKLESGLSAPQETVADQLSEIQIDEARQDSRQLIPVEVMIEVFDADKLVGSEQTVTENISRQGATIFTAMNIEPGTFVKMTGQQYEASALAVVRARSVGADGIMRLHLEFIGSEWPL